MALTKPVRVFRQLFAVAVLVVLGVFLPPRLAAVMQDNVDDDLIIPAYITLMVVAGVGMWTLVPGLAAPDTSTSRRVAVGSAIGFAVAISAFYYLVWLFADG